MKFEVGAKATSGEREVKVQSLTTAAKWFLWKKVAIEGKTYTSTDAYFQAFSTMSDGDKGEVLNLATKLCVDSHTASVAKRPQSRRGFWG